MKTILITAIALGTAITALLALCISDSLTALLASKFLAILTGIATARLIRFSLRKGYLKAITTFMKED